MSNINKSYFKYINKYIKESIDKNKDLYLTNPQYYEYNGTFLNAKYNTKYDRVLMSPLSIRFSQNNIHYFFDKSRTETLKKLNDELMFENTVFRTLKYLRDNLPHYQTIKETKKQKVSVITIPFLPINVIKVYLDKSKEKYVLISLDNRRLYVLQYIARLYYPEHLLLTLINIIDIQYKDLEEHNIQKFENNPYGTQEINITSNKYANKSLKKNVNNLCVIGRKLIDTWSWYMPFKECKYQD